MITCMSVKQFVMWIALLGNSVTMMDDGSYQVYASISKDTITWQIYPSGLYCTEDY